MDVENNFYWPKIIRAALPAAFAIIKAGLQPLQLFVLLERIGKDPIFADRMAKQVADQFARGESALDTMHRMEREGE